MQKLVKVGLVDDHPLFRQGLRLMIENSGNLEVVLEASNGVELFQILETENTFPDVILLDMEMPQMDGMQSCEKLKQDYPQIKVLILTMHQDARLIQAMMKQGANGYILKTTKWNELQKALLEVVQKDYYFSDLVSLAMLQNLQTPKKIKPSIGNSFSLSQREQEVLELIVKGKSTPEIAEILYLSQRTIEGHRSNLLKRLEVKNMAGLIVKAIKLELVPLSLL